MDIKKLMEMVLANEEIQDIPLIFVLAVMNTLISVWIRKWAVSPTVGVME